LAYAEPAHLSPEAWLHLKQTGVLRQADEAHSRLPPWALLSVCVGPTPLALDAPTQPVQKTQLDFFPLACVVLMMTAHP